MPTECCPTKVTFLLAGYPKSIEIVPPSYCTHSEAAEPAERQKVEIHFPRGKALRFCIDGDPSLKLSVVGPMQLQNRHTASDPCYGGRRYRLIWKELPRSNSPDWYQAWQRQLKSTLQADLWIYYPDCLESALRIQLLQAKPRAIYASNGQRVESNFRA